MIAVLTATASKKSAAKGIAPPKAIGPRGNNASTQARCP